ncbi:MAG: hypothetical protein WDZ30_03865 [Cellvibrionaceae bacterium]
MRSLPSIFVVLSVLAISACSELSSNVRKVTYPPDFKYVTGEELRSNMQQLAYHLQQLDEALAVEAPEQVEQQKVTATLREIERIGSRLQAGQGGANHPFLEDMMPEFVTTVGQARLRAAQNPPRYYWAGRVSGACLNCHTINR